MDLPLIVQACAEHRFRVVFQQFHPQTELSGAQRCTNALQSGAEYGNERRRAVSCCWSSAWGSVVSVVEQRDVTLSEAQIAEFRQNGIVGPFDLFSPEEAQAIKRRIRRETAKPGPHFESEGFRHLDCPTVWEVSARAEIVERLAQLLGPNLVLWRSQLFNKPPNEPNRELPWHQDASNWPIAPGNTVTAWITFDDATRESGCMEVLPGQNTTLIEQREAEGFERFRYQADLSKLDLGSSRHVEVRAGQFLLFDDLLPHRSGGNTTPAERLALAARATRPEIPIATERFFDDYRVLLLRGSHEQGVNPIGPPPIREVE